MLREQFYFPLFASLLFLSLFLLPHCATHSSSSAAALPSDIFGIGVGASKTDAVRRLEEIAVFERDERRRQQVWRLKSDKNYGHLLVGYDKQDQVRYITAVAKEKGGTKVRYGEVGDLTGAKAEIVGNSRRYTWKVPARNEKPEYLVVAQGNEPDFLTLYSLSQAFGEEAEESKEQ